MPSVSIRAATQAEDEPVAQRQIAISSAMTAICRIFAFAIDAAGTLLLTMRAERNSDAVVLNPIKKCTTAHRINAVATKPGTGWPEKLNRTTLPPLHARESSMR